MKTNLSRVLLVAVLLILAATSIYAQTVEFSATLKADQVEYFHTGWAFGGTSAGSTVWFYYSAFGEPGNDAITLESPMLILAATSNVPSNWIIHSITLDFRVIREFYLTSEIHCTGGILLR